MWSVLADLARKRVGGRLALDAGRLAKDQAQLFFERNFRPMLLGDAAARVPAKHDGTVAQTGTVSSVDEENPLQIKRTRYPLCQTGPSLDTVYGAQAVCVSANL
jgi:hypothetical protein